VNVFQCRGAWSEKSKVLDRALRFSSARSAKLSRVFAQSEDRHTQRVESVDATSPLSDNRVWNRAWGGRLIDSN
jgi:hypothetical protein